MADEWVVILRPTGSNATDPGGEGKPDRSGAFENVEGRNEGGLIIYVAKGDEQREVTRVSFVRRHSQNRDRTFKQALKAEIETAQTAADALNESDRVLSTAVRSGAQ